jgi:hypothetical protein
MNVCENFKLPPSTGNPYYCGGTLVEYLKRRNQNQKRSGEDLSPAFVLL